MQVDPISGGLVAAYAALVKALIVSGDLNARAFRRAVNDLEQAMFKTSTAAELEEFRMTIDAALRLVGAVPPAAVEMPSPLPLAISGLGTTAGAKACNMGKMPKSPATMPWLKSA